jgi:hypothetical protein
LRALRSNLAHVALCPSRLLRRSAPRNNDQIGSAGISGQHVALSAATLSLDLHIGEKRHQRMGTHRDDSLGV